MMLLVIIVLDPAPHQQQERVLTVPQGPQPMVQVVLTVV